ncbi:MAG: carboxypeptidase M32 [Lachnospiraceae bacterium]
MSDLFNKLQPMLDKSSAYNMALTLFNWDSSTLSPKLSMENTSKAIGILSMEAYNTLINDTVKDLLGQLTTEEENAKLTANEKSIVKLLNKDFEEMVKIPPEEYQAYSELSAKAGGIWEDAKNNNDFASYKDTLSQIISYQKKFAGYCKKENQSAYDYMLDQNEEGFTAAMVDEFFSKLKAAIVPLMKKVADKKDFVSNDFLFQTLDIPRQKEFCTILAKHIGFDFNKGVIAESEHPFTTSLHNKDVRITNHLHENDLMSAVFSVIHEGGHALYEMDVDDAITMTPVGGGATMGMHESQSRLYENNLGRSKEFWRPLWDQLLTTFPEFKGHTLNEFYHAINKSLPSLIRTDADELTYSLHIMIRYEIERMLFQDELSVDELPAVWNKKYQEYLGITPTTDTEGVLQDSHWSFGGFGYFPSYAIGSAIAAQLIVTMKKTLPVDQYLTEGNLEPIHQFLKEHIHKYGATKTTDELLKETTGEGFNPDYFIEYLTQKYTDIYEL